ncbi:hypothetical protein TSUD_72360 [Trifolium subterraneum]|uniref:Neprosin PEP catalytic domain-containing protein n=1 Tax=Trifolium subterraneum TaxID=3900 RepID=A0A2Z6N6D0_TRISU|nr:hypothetical protein TSUD_72360 [Trifolium subterraneum]
MPEEQHYFTGSDIIMVNNDFQCVDIYQQPSLQHPLLTNHKIQLYPTFAKNIMQNRSSYGKSMVKCPEGKVPIYNKTGRHQIITNSSSKLQIDDFQQYSQSAHGYHTVSLDTTQNTIFHGAHAAISGYGLSIEANHHSISSIWIESGPPTELNSIKVGVGADGYKKTGCYNYRCPGFVQVNHDKEYALGSLVTPLNSIGSTEKVASFIKIKQDRSTGHWWLIIQLEPIYVGYWPKELFNHLSRGASSIRFAGQTYSPPNKDSHPMGSGRLPKEKFRNSAFMAILEIIDSEYNEVAVKDRDMKSYTDTHSECYDLAYNGYQ